MSIQPVDEHVIPEKRVSLASWLRSWRYFFALAGVFVAIVCFYGEENWRGARAWAQYKQQMEARGSPHDPSALLPPMVPDDENFAMSPALASIFTRVPPGSNSGTPFQGEQRFSARFDAASSALKLPKTRRTNSWILCRTDLAAWQAAFELSRKPLTQQTGHDPTMTTNLPGSEAAAAVLASLASCDPVLKELHAASQRPYCRFNIQYNADVPASILLPHLAPIKGVCQILQLRTAAELECGQVDAAFNDLCLMLHLADAHRDEPLLICQLVRLAEFHIALLPLAEGLADHRWSEPQLRALQERLEQFDFCADVKRGLEGERVWFGERMIDYLRRSRADIGQYMDCGGRAENLKETFLRNALFRLAPSGWFDFERCNYSRFFGETILSPFDPANHRIDPRASQAGVERIEGLSRDSWSSLFLRHRLLTVLMLLGFSNAARETAFAQTGADLGAVACALERFRLARGQFPASLDELVPLFSRQLPRDVLSGQPLNYRLSGDGQYLLYSVGWNQTDDGGVIGVSTNSESADPRQGDWVWRLPARGQ